MLHWVSRSLTMGLNKLVSVHCLEPSTPLFSHKRISISISLIPVADSSSQTARGVPQSLQRLGHENVRYQPARTMSPVAESLPDQPLKAPLAMSIKVLVECGETSQSHSSRESIPAPFLGTEQRVVSSLIHTCRGGVVSSIKFYTRDRN